MNRGGLAPVWILALALLCAIKTVPAETAGDPDKQLELIVQGVQDGTVTSIEIFALAKDIETRASVSPERLRTYPSVLQVRIRDLDRGRQRFLEALRHTKVAAFHTNADMRRGIILYSHNSPVFSMYLDKFEQGEINGVRAKFSGQLAPWVESCLPPDYR